MDINEAFTTQMCSHCGVIPQSSPKGMGALGMRDWVCSSCGINHDRDVNAAKNILNLALSVQRPDEESQLNMDKHIIATLDGSGKAPCEPGELRTP